MNVEDYEIDGAAGQPSGLRAQGSAACVTRSAVRIAHRAWARSPNIARLLLLAPIEVCGNYSDLLDLARLHRRPHALGATRARSPRACSGRCARAKESDDEPDVIFMTDGQEAPPLRPGVASELRRREARADSRLARSASAATRRARFREPIGRAIVLGYWRAEDVIQRTVDRDRTRQPSHEHLSVAARAASAGARAAGRLRVRAPRTPLVGQRGDARCSLC